MDKSTDRIINRFDYGRLAKQVTFPVITVYKNPTDYPDKYVARAFDMARPTCMVAVADTYEELLTAIPVQSMARMERNPKDDPAIMETWI